jgi:hypothetical protein
VGRTMWRSWTSAPHGSPIIPRSGSPASSAPVARVSRTARRWAFTVRGRVAFGGAAGAGRNAWGCGRVWAQVFPERVDVQDRSLVPAQYNRWCPSAADDSAMSQGYTAGKISGLGMNADELVRNKVLTDYEVKDLNADPKLPYPDNTFDVVTNAVSVDYLTKPQEVGHVVPCVVGVGSGGEGHTHSAHGFPRRTNTCLMHAVAGQKAQRSREQRRMASSCESCTSRRASFIG